MKKEEITGIALTICLIVAIVSIFILQLQISDLKKEVSDLNTLMRLQVRIDNEFELHLTDITKQVSELNEQANLQSKLDTILTSKLKLVFNFLNMEEVVK